MAAGEHAGADGRAWIAAAAVAYEVQCRLCDAASIRARGWDHTTYGSLSTALAAAKLLGLDHAQTVHALGIAGTTGDGAAADPGRRAVDVEGLRLRLRGPQRRLRRAAGPRGDDRPRPAVRGGHGLLPAGLRPVRRSPQLGGPVGRRLDAAEDLDQVRPGRVPQPVGHRRRVRAPAADRRPVADPVDRDRHLPHGRRDHRPGPREVAAEDPRDGRPQPPLLHGRRARRRRGHGRPVHARAAGRPRPARPRRADDRRRGPRPDRRLSRRASRTGSR